MLQRLQLDRSNRRGSTRRIAEPGWGRLCWAVGGVAFVLCTSPAAAQHEPDPSHTAPGSEPSPRERAKQLVEEGFRHFEQGDLAGACERFERSIAEHASAEGLLNAGICRDHAGDALGALEAFEAALVAAAEQPDPAVRAGYREDLPRRIAAVQPKICAPSGAAFFWEMGTFLIC
jgi:Tfp pilus assembly protein PilF